MNSKKINIALTIIGIIGIIVMTVAIYRTEVGARVLLVIFVIMFLAGYLKLENK